jgi:two-component system sensor histidine kinase/response regulator
LSFGYRLRPIGPGVTTWSRSSVNDMETGNSCPRILIIDDEQVVLESCTEILLDQPYEVATATNGARGLELVEEYDPDLVFVDLKMPGLSGLEVLEEINRNDPTVVTVVITGYATIDSAIGAMKSGAYDFMPKPFTPDQFRVITARSLEKRKLVLETIALRREKETLRENFAAIVSHELKSPLSAVQQNLFVLEHQLSSVASEEQLRQIERMKSRIDNLLELVNTWLRGVSVDLNGIRERFRTVPLAAPLSRAVESVERHATRKAVGIVVEEHGEVVFGDEGTLAEALTNVIGNAVKYSYEGGIVTVTTKDLDHQVRIDVSDTGVGIPNGDKSHIFDDFYRASTVPRQEGGVGLGLAISRRIVEAHRGSVSVESEVGQGTTFTILLPAEAPDPPRQDSPPPERREV